jgi:hypothetical protein
LIGPPILARVQPNRPKMVTIIVAVLLLVVGLALVFFQAESIDLVKQVGLLPGDIQRQIVGLMAEKFLGWALLAASPILLILGSLLPGI